MKEFYFLLIQIVFSHIAVREYNTNELITNIFIEQKQIETTKELTLLITNELIVNHNYTKFSLFEYYYFNETISQNEDILLADIGFNPYQDDHSIIYFVTNKQFPSNLSLVQYV